MDLILFLVIETQKFQPLEVSESQKIQIELKEFDPGDVGNPRDTENNGGGTR
jgi:hypothetical protein